MMQFTHETRVKFSITYRDYVPRMFDYSKLYLRSPNAENVFLDWQSAKFWSNFLKITTASQNSARLGWELAPCCRFAMRVYSSIHYDGIKSIFPVFAFRISRLCAQFSDKHSIHILAHFVPLHPALQHTVFPQIHKS